MTGSRIFNLQSWPKILEHYTLLQNLWPWPVLVRYWPVSSIDDWTDESLQAHQPSITSGRPQDTSILSTENNDMVMWHWCSALSVTVRTAAINTEIEKDLHFMFSPVDGHLTITFLLLYTLAWQWQTHLLWMIFIPFHSDQTKHAITVVWINKTRQTTLNRTLPILRLTQGLRS